jgi:hypothetical protein
LALDQTDLILHNEQVDSAMLLLVDVAYEALDPLIEHLPSLVHIAVLGLDRKEKLVYSHAKLLVANLLHSLVVKRISPLSAADEVGDEEEEIALDTALQVIDMLRSKKGALWKQEDATMEVPEPPSSAEVFMLVRRLVDSFSFYDSFVDKWGQVSLNWAAHSPNQRMAVRSHQIYRALRPIPTCEATLGVLNSLAKHLNLASNPELLAFPVQILLTLQTMVESLEQQKLILLPQLFWSCVALIHSPLRCIYERALALTNMILERMDLTDPNILNILFASLAPDHPDFLGIQPQIFQGLYSESSEAAALQLLHKFTNLPCPDLVDASPARLLMNMTALLPKCCQRLQEGPSPESNVYAEHLAQAFQARGMLRLSKVRRVTVNSPAPPFCRIVS